MAGRIASALLCAGLVAGAASPARASEGEVARSIRELQDRIERLEQADGNALDVKWSNGFAFEGPNVKGKIGGRIHLDYFHVNSADSDVRNLKRRLWQSGAGFRRVRLETEADVSPEGAMPFKYKVQMDFAGPAVAYRDVYMDFKDLPAVGTLRLGHFKEPFGLEELTSSNNITFQERSMATSTFAPSRNLGLMVTDRAADGMVRWAFGVFRGFERGGEWKATGRIGASPIYENGGEQVLHVGAAASYRGIDGDNLRFHQRPENSFSDRIVDTGNFQADHELRYGLEAATVMGPFSVQAEYMVSGVKDNDAAVTRTPVFHGGYIFGSVFLTPGDKRNYSRSSAAFSGVRPANNLGEGGIGAVELAMRLSHLDLNYERAGKGNRVGRATNVSGGVNWYLNPMMRVMLNQVYSDQNRLGDSWTTMCRFQVSF